ncbi:odontogenesis associated phosphoprotein [Tenrec ecaudatus]|uniref:odontogenesis associated phosphoprotein n=1 Tax=Tenrec ecaudatus TaxID=94439 RepID=UPI003F5972C2
MAPSFCLFSWVLVCCLVIAVVEGQGVTTPPGDSHNDVDPTNCQIFTLTPPPATRNPVTKIQPITRTPKCPFHVFPRRKPRFHTRFLHRPSLPPRCNHRFLYRPFWPLRGQPTGSGYIIVNPNIFYDYYLQIKS